MKTRPCKAPENWRDLKPHPLSEVIEFGAGIDLDAFEAFMLEHGYDESEPIILIEDGADPQILDGRHKFAVALKLNIRPSFAMFAGSNPMAFVLKKIHRQHLDDAQRAEIAAKLATVPLGANQHTKKEGGPNGPPSMTTEKAAKALNVSVQRVKRAKEIGRAHV